MVRNTVDGNRECGDKVGEDKKVLQPEPGLPFTNYHIGIGGKEVRPAHRHRVKSAILESEGYRVLSPELLRHHEGKRSTRRGWNGWVMRICLSADG
jgi:hypothetical protein